MSDDYHYQEQKPMEEEEIEETLEAKFKNMTDKEFEIFYRHLIHRLGVSRHASPEIQIWAILSVDRFVITKILAEVQRKYIV